ncbi:MAG TPA: hypothetical protein PKE40_10685 [Arachnia sp.]|mgnify:CR=1 FL=1|nr:hypothetical protein [Arachnia sp.]HMT86810.1 hypothetical protein [Arachnia sp.]
MLADPEYHECHVGRDACEIPEGVIEGSELARSDQVLVVSHPVAGFSFHLDFPIVARALEHGAEATPLELERLLDYLDDDTTPSWVLRRIIEDRLPSAEAALARALDRPGFRWEEDGEQLLLSTPGANEPQLSRAIAPSLCAETA